MLFDTIKCVCCLFFFFYITCINFITTRIRIRISGKNREKVKLKITVAVFFIPSVFIKETLQFQLIAALLI